METFNYYNTMRNGRIEEQVEMQEKEILNSKIIQNSRIITKEL